MIDNINVNFFHRRFFPPPIFWNPFNFQSWHFFSKEALDTLDHQSFAMGGLCRAFLEIFFAEWPEFQLGILILRQKYIPF
jgi:hypothetical protein